MWDNLSIYWKESIGLAIEAMYAGSLAIGAVITDSEGTIVSKGRNRIFEPIDVEGQISGCSVAHAELNALANIPTHTSRSNLRLYTTAEPCPMCVGAVSMSKVKEIHYASRDNWAGSIDMLDKTAYLRHKSIHAVGPQSDEIEKVLIALHVYCHLRLDDSGRLDFLFDRWAEIVPQGVELGKRIYRSKAFSNLINESVEAKKVIDFLANRLRTK